MKIVSFNVDAVAKNAHVACAIERPIRQMPELSPS